MKILNKQIFKNKETKILLTISLFSFLLIFLFSKNSPFYVYNNWGDVNAYFTMGKGLFNDKVMFKDLFEQKGPLIYIIYGLSYLISNTSFIGAYFLESIAMTCTLYFSYKIAKLYFKPNLALAIMTFVPIFVLDKRILVLGGSAEEFVLAFQMVSTYFFISYFQNKKTSIHNPKIMLIHGLMISSIIMIKFNLAILEIGYISFIFLNILIKKEYKNFFKNLLYLFIGISIIIIPFLIYFIITDSFNDFIFAYFKFNAMYGGVKGSTPILIKKALLDVYRFVKIPCILIILGVPIFALSKKYLTNMGRISFLIMFIIHVLIIYLSGRVYMYMFLPISVFTLYFFIILFDIIKFFYHKLEVKYIYTFIFMLFCILTLIKSDNNINESKLFMRDTAEMKLARIINNYKDASVLNYGSLDDGFYTLTNTVPDIKYFHRLNIDYKVYPEMMNKQREYLRTKKTMFIVIKIKNYHDSKYRPVIPYLDENYYYVTSERQVWNRRKFTYYLYQAKNTM